MYRVKFHTVATPPLPPPPLFFIKKIQCKRYKGFLLEKKTPKLPYFEGKKNFKIWLGRKEGRSPKQSKILKLFYFPSMTSSAPPSSQNLMKIIFFKLKIYNLRRKRTCRSWSTRDWRRRSDFYFFLKEKKKTILVEKVVKKKTHVTISKRRMFGYDIRVTLLVLSCSTLGLHHHTQLSKWSQRGT